MSLDERSFNDVREVKMRLGAVQLFYRKPHEASSARMEDSQGAGKSNTSVPGVSAAAAGGCQPARAVSIIDHTFLLHSCGHAYSLLSLGISLLQCLCGLAEQGLRWIVKASMVGCITGYEARQHRREFQWRAGCRDNTAST